jgi:acyl transferase domain-containing protein
MDHIECHGTGTRAGDTTEIESLVQLWKGASADAGVCAIGSVKSMIGHLLTAAGAAGMIKTLLAIKHQTLPPAINFEKAPKTVRLRGSPFKVQTQGQPLEFPRQTPGALRSALSVSAASTPISCSKRGRRIHPAANHRFPTSITS